MESLKDFCTEISILLDNSEYAEVKNRLEIKLDQLNKDEGSYPYILAEIAGFYIGIG